MKTRVTKTLHNEIRRDLVDFHCLKYCFKCKRNQKGSRF
ncbi:hypothetical protein MIR68_002273 [Amoeboaphelidium protococcarum]|nr:hypothetical protein MIR68_002273 [Amoeboaphelidium protococcarum]